MGLVRLGPPEDLVLYLKGELGASAFVETGTFHGRTSYWASQHFDDVYTIELSQELHREAQSRYEASANIAFLFGDSRAVLSELGQKLSRPAIFWLDAHYCSGNTAGFGGRCPLIEEVAVLNSYFPTSCILVDDARLFLAPPPKPHPCDEYPTIGEVLNCLNGQVPRYTVIFEDVIVSVPLAMQGRFADFLQEKVTIADLAYWKQYHQGHLAKSLIHLRKALATVVRRIKYGVKSRLRWGSPG